MSEECFVEHEYQSSKEVRVWVHKVFMILSSKGSQVAFNNEVKREWHVLGWVQNIWYQAYF